MPTDRPPSFRRILAGAAALALLVAGCYETGHSASGNDASGGGTSAPAGATTTAATPLPTTFPALADGAVAAAVTLGETEGAAQPAQVVTFGHAFPQGAVRGHLVVRDSTRVLPTQVDVKRRHADGSVRHAILSIAAPALAANTTRPLEIVASSSAPGAGAIDPQSALAQGFDTRVEIVEGGLAYSISARELLGGAAERWLAGPLVTELRVGGVPRAGATPHPALGVYFDVRFLAGGGARVSVAVENTFHDSPGNRRYDVRVSTPAGVAFERTNVEHLYHARWRTVVWWSAMRSTLQVAADWRTLKSAGAIPRYDAAIAIDPAAVDAAIGRWDASAHDVLETGAVVGAMPMAGGRPDLGPLPQWIALALVAGDPRAYRMIAGTGEAGGGFSTHLRDRADGRLYSIDAHPTTSINPRNPAVGRDADPADLLPECTTCSSPYIADRAHQPSLAYVPYLVTGDAYFWDELKFWANYNFLEVPARDYHGPQRGYSQGLVHVDEPRGQAWSMRTLGHAAWIAPDADGHRDYFESKLANNLAWYRANAVDSNPFGWWEGFDATANGRPQTAFAADVTFANQPWQNDFLLLAFDGLARMGYVAARPMRDWLARWAIGRFTTPAEFNPNEGDAYALAVRGAGGAAYASWREIYQRSTANRTTPAPGMLADLDCAFCYVAIAQAALAGPVADGVAGAAEAHRFVAAQLAPHRAMYRRDPTFAIAP